MSVGDVEPRAPVELERLASAAYLGGRRDESYESWAAAHSAYIAQGDVARAVRCAFWIAFALLNSGELARGGGWIDRAQRLLDEAGLECVEHGHLRYATALKDIFSDDGEAAYAGFTTAVQIGDRFGDIELGTLARIGVGRCLIYMGEVAAGVALLDEAMVSVGAEEVEIVLAVGDVEGARAAADELTQLSEQLNAPAVAAMAAHARGAVLVASGDGRAALKQLRTAWTIWHELEAPYEAARTRVLLAQACRLVGDDDGAVMELDAARATFDQLGAVPDVARVDFMSGVEDTAAPAGLTAREVEVLRLVAKGKTNRAIADELIVSEKTVSSHLSHIFTKLDLTSRAAATAFAYDNGLV